MSNKKFFIFALASFLALAFAAAPALAAKTPPAIDDTYTIDGVTYYNVNSQNFDSNKKFYEDVFNAKHSSLGGRSLAELWMLTAVGVGKTLPLVSNPNGMSSVLDYAKETVLNGQYEYATGRDNHVHNYKAPQWNNSKYVETTLNVQAATGAKITITVRFSDFGVGVILPGKSSHYVSTVIDNDTSKGEEPASSAKNDSGTAAAITQSISKHISATMSSTIDHSFSYGFKEGIKVGAGFNAGIFSIAGEISFEANQTITDGWSKTDTKSDGKDINNSVSVTLPPYTTAMMKQGETNATMTTNYNCPVMLSYKVNILYQLSPLLGMGPTSVTFGPKARDDLQKRALVDVDYDPKSINWRTVLADSDFKDAIEKIATHVPMSPTGAKMVYTSRSVYNEVTGIAALYPLSYVSLGWPNLSFISGNKDRAVANMTIGEYSYTNYLPLEGYNDMGAAYYGFNKSYGEWRVVDEAGNELTGDAAPVTLEKTSSGYMKYTAKRPGKCFLKYFIAENAYPSGLGSKSYTKNSDLSRTAQLEVNVAGEKVDYQIEGEYNGVVNSEPENIEGDGKLEVHAYNADDIEVDAPYSWEKRELKGITLAADGTASFTKPGTFHVRVRSNADKNVYSAWKAISAIVTGDDYVEEDIPLIRSEFADGDTQFVVTGRFLGGANISESLEGEGKFQVETHTGNGQETSVKYTWEAQEAGKGITLAGDGMASFDNPGVYHVRLRSQKAASEEAGVADAESGAVASEWLEVWVNEKAPARLLRVPTANNYYNAATPELLYEDARYEGGVCVLYGLGTDAATKPTEYSTVIPTATGAGTYYVWCKVKGDENHTDSSPVCVTVTMEAVEGDDSGEGGESGSGVGSGSSSSGCDTGFAGVALLALAGLGALKRRQGKR